MSDGKTQALGRLAAAERYFDLRLREAQLAQAQSETALAVEHRKKADIEAERASIDAHCRGLLESSGSLTAAQLEHVALYASWVAVRLEEQGEAVAAALGDCDSKRSQTRSCFREITALRRVCERRLDLAKKEEQRSTQRLLDALAALKLSSERVDDESDLQRS